MFKWPCYKNGSDMQKKSHHHETQEFSLELKYKLCDYDYIKIMVGVHDNIACETIDPKV